MGSFPPLGVHGDPPSSFVPVTCPYFSLLGGAAGPALEKVMRANELGDLLRLRCLTVSLSFFFSLSHSLSLSLSLFQASSKLFHGMGCGPSKPSSDDGAAYREECSQ